MAIIASGVAAMGILAALAVRADSEASQASPWLTAMDVVVGLAFVAASAAAGGPLPERVLVAAAGPAWLAGSFLLAARSLHQLVLAVALVVFPYGRVRGLASWLLVGLAGLAGLQLLPELGVAALFAAVAAVALVRFRRDLVAAWYPVAAAAGVAAVLAASWAATHLTNGTFDPTLALLGYELVLLLVAVAFPLAVRAVMRARARLADRLLSDQRFAGLDGLAVVLGDALGDRDLRVYRWHEGDGAYVDARGQRVVPSGDRRWLAIGDLGRPVAAVAHRASALDDPPTAAAVSSAVRLAVTHLRLLEEQRTRLRELEAARTRIVAAADRQRERAAAALQQIRQAVQYATICGFTGSPDSMSRTNWAQPDDTPFAQHQTPRTRDARRVSTNRRGCRRWLRSGELPRSGPRPSRSSRAAHFCCRLAPLRRRSHRKELTLELLDQLFRVRAFCHDARQTHERVEFVDMA